jgi:hypothetical protein
LSSSWIARIFCARNVIFTDYRCLDTSDAFVGSALWIACVNVAEIARIYANAVCWSVNTSSKGFIANINSASDSVIAQSVVCLVDTGSSYRVATVDGASNVISAIVFRMRASSTGANVVSAAVGIIAQSVVVDVNTFVGDGIADVNSAGVAIVTVGVNWSENTVSSSRVARIVSASEVIVTEL